MPSLRIQTKKDEKSNEKLPKLPNDDLAIEQVIDQGLSPSLQTSPLGTYGGTTTHLKSEVQTPAKYLKLENQ